MSKKNKVGWQRILALIIPYFLIVGIFQFVGAIIVDIDLSNLEPSRTIEQHFVMQLLTFLSTLIVVCFFVKFLDKEDFISIGFDIGHRLYDFVYGVLVGFLIMLLGYLSLQFSNEIQFNNIIFDSKAIILTALLYIFVAISEELLMRGYILRNLIVSFNKYVALIISAILFSIMHGANPNITLIAFINLFLAGILLGISYIHTKNLWFPISLHFSWNFFQTLFGFNVSGMDSYSLINFNIAQNNIWNGGDFGFEGSILSILAQIVIIVFVGMYYRKHE